MSLQARQAALSTAVARLLIENNEAEEQTAQRVQAIYDQVQRQVYWFLTATLVAIAATGLYVIRANRRLFAELASLSDGRRELAQQLIATRESTLQSLVARAARRSRPDSDRDRLDARPGREADARRLAAPRRPARDRRDGARHAQQRAKPVADACTRRSSRSSASRARSTGISGPSRSSWGSPSRTSGPAPLCRWTTTIGIHVYRVLQEALSNVARHSGHRSGLGTAALPPRRARARGRGSWFGSGRTHIAGVDSGCRHARAGRARRRDD